MTRLELEHRYASTVVVTFEQVAERGTVSEQWLAEQRANDWHYSER